jgi:hypothetical protein
MGLLTEYYRYRLFLPIQNRRQNRRYLRLQKNGHQNHHRHLH